MNSLIQWTEIWSLYFMTENRNLLLKIIPYLDIAHRILRLPTHIIRQLRVQIENRREREYFWGSRRIEREVRCEGRVRQSPGGKWIGKLSFGSNLKLQVTSFSKSRLFLRTPPTNTLTHCSLANFCCSYF